MQWSNTELEKSFNIPNASEKSRAVTASRPKKYLLPLSLLYQMVSNLKHGQCLHGHVNLIDYTGNEG